MTRTQAQTTYSHAPDGWIEPSDLAPYLEGVDSRTLSKVARAYTEHASGTHPVLRRETDSAPGDASYLYRVDRSADIRGEDLRAVADALGETHADLGRRLGMGASPAQKAIRENRWIGPAYHDEAAELVEEHVDRDVDWYALCDAFLDRLVVDSVHASAETAARQSGRRGYSGETCDPVIVKGAGAEPSHGEGLKRVDESRIIEPREVEV